MENKRNAEYYLHTDKETGDIKIFMIVDGKIKIKGNKEKDINYSLRYISNTASYMGAVKVYSNTQLTSEQKEGLTKSGNVLYFKSYNKHPEIFSDFLRKYEKAKNKDSHSYLSMNIFKHDEHDFIAINIKINEFKRTLIKLIKNKKNNDESIMLSFLKDIIPNHIDYNNSELPIIFKTGDKEIVSLFHEKMINESISNRIEKIEYEEFDKTSLVIKNYERISTLIKNHGHHLRIKDEVLANYDSKCNLDKIVIYTDASTFINEKYKINNGLNNESGIGIVVKQDGCDDVMFKINKKIEVSRDEWLDNNDSEGKAIFEALKFIKKSNLIDDDTVIEIRSDSISNVRKLNHLEKHSLISKQIENYCKVEMGKVKKAFRWVKGHATYKYNVMADELADQSISNPDFELKVESFPEQIEIYQNRNKQKRLTKKLKAS